jgi:hypothetical protein
MCKIVLQLSLDDSTVVLESQCIIHKSWGLLIDCGPRLKWLPAWGGSPQHLMIQSTARDACPAWLVSRSSRAHLGSSQFGSMVALEMDSNA